MNKAICALKGLLQSTLKSPKLTLNHLTTLTSAVRGLQFGHANMLAAGSPADASAQAELPNPLLDYFETHREGPGIWKWRQYFDVYQRHFNKFVGREVHVMEVGIYSGGSLPMWRHYFGEKCHVYGVDIEEACKVYEDKSTRVLIGDQADRSFWKKVRQDIPTIDILIDDGGHEPEQQLVTLEEMLPNLRPGGVYLCEDIHGADNEFAAYLHGLANHLNTATFTSPPDGEAGSACAASLFQKSIHSLHLYPFCAVIEKTRQPVEYLVAPKRGTHWQPFL